MAWRNKTFGHLYSPYPHEKFKTKCQRFFLVVGHHQHFFSKLDRVQIITNASIFLEMTTKNSIFIKLRSSHMYLPSASASLWCQWHMHAHIIISPYYMHSNSQQKQLLNHESSSTRIWLEETLQIYFKCCSRSSSTYLVCTTFNTWKCESILWPSMNHLT